MGVPRPAEVTRERVQRFAGAMGGIGFTAGVGFGQLLSGASRSNLEFYAISGFTVLTLILGGYQLRRWPPARF